MFRRREVYTWRDKIMSIPHVARTALLLAEDVNLIIVLGRVWHTMLLGIDSVRSGFALLPICDPTSSFV